jgi:CRISPR-associated endonuclease Csy4
MPAKTERMDHYTDIHLRAHPEWPAHHLMTVMYAKLHRVLIRLQTSAIGVSFPGYSTSPHTLGTTLRLLGSASELARLMEQNWLTGMRDHTELTPVAAVPADAAHRSLRRVQAKSSPERLRRRHMRRHNLSAAQARERVPDNAAELLQLPFVAMTSSSTGQNFPVFLRLGPVVAAPHTGSFNAYGLSNSATIPWF